ncbi:MFS transporter [Shimia abyssi]|uniref:MFS-type transporter involved in bile tolerance (Atg22 family) n=1 Tax=Shimia abyssi TaxID=1662395 RepID=A0A2P8FEC7_9RHOB|nr:MFS transporter [Shimia abyssi]PSL20075.1 MFS-type transporter involved in bile tolerance (Atg22 family) [Shimia abyssi]
MSNALLIRNRNYRLLFSAGALTNLGDGMIVLALPWLASLMTRDPVAIAAVAAATRLPWLLFSVPAGVVVDRADRRKLMARADLMRAAMTAAILLLALSPHPPGAVWLLAGLAFLLGSAEVLRDNAAQTILPLIVDKDDLEAANGQLWSAEQLTGQFLGPPLAGILIALGIALPFGLNIVSLSLAAGMVWLITLRPVPPKDQNFVKALREGIAFMRSDRLLLRLAIVLGIANFIAMATITMQVLLAQEVLGLTSAQYGLVLSIQALGAIAGSLFAPVLVRRLGVHPCLYLSVGGWAVGYGVVGLSNSGWVMGGALFMVLFAAMLWNVITVSWRQRRIPSELLGRVNSIYRFFGWGSMPLGALAGGAVVSLLEPGIARDLALRAPFLLASVACVLLLIYAIFRLRLD